MTHKEALCPNSSHDSSPSSRRSQAIRVFEAVARHLSFTKAAEELGMTQAAASYQIKLLEERVGAPLFLRRPRQIVLTEAGQRLAPAVSEAFALLSGAYAAARGGADGVLCVSTLLTFASNWLAQHLGSFQLAHPSLAVRLDTSNRLVDFAREDIDIAIRSGGGKWPGVEAHKLSQCRFHTDAQPEARGEHRWRQGAGRPVRLPILDPSDIWWREWFAAAGVPADELASTSRHQHGRAGL